MKVTIIGNIERFQTQWNHALHLIAQAFKRASR